MKCKVSQSWLSQKARLKRILCKAGILQNTLAKKAFSDSRDRHNSDKGIALSFQVYTPITIINSYCLYST